MAKNERIDESISSWLEETAQPRLPERVLEATFARTRKSRQQVGWRALIGRLQIPQFMPALGGAAVLVLAAFLALGLYANRPGVGAPPSPTASPTPEAAFVGNWEATDPPPESSNLTMEVVALPNGTYDVTIRDDGASVCGGASSTMTGVAVASEPGTIVIAEPGFACDDGSEAQGLSGPQLLEQLRNTAFTYDPDSEGLRDSGGLLWSRAGAAPTPAPTESGTPEPSADPLAAIAGNWENDEESDGGHQTMTVTNLPDGTYEVTIRDDIASVCSGTPSTLTGIAEVAEPRTIVIAQPDYQCDDGSEPQALSGPPLLEQLRNLGFTYDPGNDTLRDSGGLVFTRVQEGLSPTESPEGQPIPFAGNWEATDGPPDSSHLNMEVVALPSGTYDITVLDDVASVCDGTPSTMTGVAVASEPGIIVIAQPDYQCDDGSEPEAMSGPPLLEQLRNLSFTYVPGSDELDESLGLVWSRVEEPARSG